MDGSILAQSLKLEGPYLMAQHGACTLSTVTLSLEIYNADEWLDETHVGSFPSTTAMPASVLFMSRHCKEYGNKFVWVKHRLCPCENLNSDPQKPHRVGCRSVPL